MFYYDKETLYRRFAFQAFEHTMLPGFMFMVTSPVVARRSWLFGSYGAPDDFPDITFIWPGGEMLPGIIASEVPLVDPGERLRLSTDPDLRNDKPLPKLRTLFKPRDQTSV